MKSKLRRKFRELDTEKQNCIATEQFFSVLEEMGFNLNLRDLMEMKKRFEIISEEKMPFRDVIYELVLNPKNDKKWKLKKNDCST